MSNIKSLDIIGAEEACRLCGKISNQHLQHLILSGQIPAVKISGRWILLRSDVLAFQQTRVERSKNDGRIRLKK